MKKNKDYNNSLIKRKKLIILLKEGGIKRFGKEAIWALEKEIISKLKENSKLMARNLLLGGRKTLTKEDVAKVAAAKAKEESNFEI